MTKGPFLQGSNVRASDVSRDSEMKEATAKLQNGRTIKGWVDGADRVAELQSIGFDAKSCLRESGAAPKRSLKLVEVSRKVNPCLLHFP